MFYSWTGQLESYPPDIKNGQYRYTFQGYTDSFLYWDTVAQQWTLVSYRLKFIDYHNRRVYFENVLLQATKQYMQSPMKQKMENILLAQIHGIFFMIPVNICRENIMSLKI